jgi:hypothetical protein
MSPVALTSCLGIDRVMGENSHSTPYNAGPTVKKYCELAGASHTQYRWGSNAEAS